MKKLKALALMALAAVFSFGTLGCSGDGGDDLYFPPVHSHTYATYWTIDETHHWHSATCEHNSLVKDKSEHAFPENWNLVKPATETEDGLEKRLCIVCGYSTMRIILMLNHNHNVDRNSWSFDETSHWHAADCGKPAHNEDFAPHEKDSGTVTKTASCTEKGEKTYKCTVCGEVLDAEEIPVLGHKWGTYVSNNDATTQVDGTKTAHCTREGCSETDTVTDVGSKKPALTYNWYETPVDAATGKPATSSSTYIYFGVFPKTVLAANSTVTVDETDSVEMGSCTYYKGSDGEYYAKVMENAYGTGSAYKYSDGTQANRISAKSYRWFKVEPIKWKVIYDSYGLYSHPLLLAEDIITANIPYYVSASTRTIGGNTVYANNYMYSTIRAYLNGSYESSDTQSKTAYAGNGFLQTAFTEKAQSLISREDVLNDESNATDYNMTVQPSPDFCTETTSDRIFLLSMFEATHPELGFSDFDISGQESGRIRQPTDYAKANYANISSYSSGGSWWLRSPGSDFDTDASCVNEDGLVLPDSVDDKSCGVVPALVLGNGTRPVF